jgi:sulfur-carrier protein adenylyltransferase/sulfurtransferase
MLNDTRKKGFFFKTTYTSEHINQIKNLHDLRTILTHDETDSEWLKCSEESLFCAILIDVDNQIHCFLKISADSEKLSKVTLLCSDSTIPNPRIPEGSHTLSGKTIGIVGVGSVGSKIAISLARSGIEKFYLIDEDIFLPCNTCRNSLDWRNVGEYKVHAVAEAVAYISATVQVDVATLNLGGQESSLALDRVLRRLGRCDLIIDATASPQVFNLLALVAKTSAKPLVWGEVFAGGIGGMVARSRPEHEPEPQIMRALFYEFLSMQDVPLPLTLNEPYRLESQAMVILEASDADITIIASHLTRLAIDTLLLKVPSSFLYPMYLIGLQKEWIFKAPFHTIPIDTMGFDNQQESQPDSSETVSKELEFLERLLKGEDNADSSA